jgi:hypothetical protein
MEIEAVHQHDCGSNVRLASQLFAEDLRDIAVLLVGAGEMIDPARHPPLRPANPSRHIATAPWSAAKARWPFYAEGCGWPTCPVACTSLTQ